MKIEALKDGSIIKNRVWDEIVERFDKMNEAKYPLKSGEERFMYEYCRKNRVNTFFFRRAFENVF